MNNHGKNAFFQRAFRIANQFLPVLFWVTLILGFEEPGIAILTILSAIIHEGGHIAFLKLKKRSNSELRGVISGFRIHPGAMLTYHEELMLYLSGPLANLCAALLFSFFKGEAADLLCTLNVATAVSNLFPVEGYDGYGILHSILEKKSPVGLGIRLLDALSSGIVFSFCILSIYFIDRFGCGYWIFAVFFISMLKQLEKRLKNIKTEN